MSKIEILNVKFNWNFSNIINKIITKNLSKHQLPHFQARGHKMAIFAHDHIGIEINQHGVYEKEYLNTLFQFLQPIKSILKNGTALDVGANIGNHSLFFSEHFKNVESFEPHPHTFKILDFNTSFRSNIQTNNFGLGASNLTTTIYENSTNIGASSILNENSADKIGYEIKVKVTDEISKKYNNVELIKIDVENYEENVLMGTLNTIKKHKPIIVFEQHEQDFENNTTPVIKLIQSQGYTICWIKQKLHNKHKFIRFIFDIIRLFVSDEYIVQTNDKITRDFYPMLIGVPERFKKQLLPKTTN